MTTFYVSRLVLLEKWCQVVLLQVGFWLLVLYFENTKKAFALCAQLRLTHSVIISVPEGFMNDLLAVSLTSECVIS